MANKSAVLAVRILGDAKGLTGELGKAESAIGGFAKKAAGLAAGFAVGTAFVNSFQSALNLEKASDKLAAQLGLTEQQSERAGEIAGNLYAGAWGDSIEQVNQAVGAVLSSVPGIGDQPQAEIESLTASVLDLATAFEVDVDRAAQVVGQTVSSGLAGDAVEATDLIVSSLQKVPAALREDVLDAVSEYSDEFANVGIVGEEAFGILVANAEKGAFGIDKAGDAIKEFGIRATDGSKASTAAFESLGLDAEKFTRDIASGGDAAEGAFQTVVAELASIEDPALKAQTAIALFGTPLEDLGTEGIPAFLDSLAQGSAALGDDAGAAAEFGDTLNDNAATRIESFKRTLEQGIVSFIGDQVIPALSGIGDFVTRGITGGLAERSTSTPTRGSSTF